MFPIKITALNSKEELAWSGVVLVYLFRFSAIHISADFAGEAVSSS